MGSDCRVFVCPAIWWQMPTASRLENDSARRVSQRSGVSGVRTERSADDSCREAFPPVASEQETFAEERREAARGVRTAYPRPRGDT